MKDVIFIFNQLKKKDGSTISDVARHNMTLNRQNFRVNITIHILFPSRNIELKKGRTFRNLYEVLHH